MIVSLVAIQFVPVQRTNPPAGPEPDAPASVLSILHRACYDCHSATTRWPWYAHLAPVSWVVTQDVRRARHKLDFTDWPVTDATEQADIGGVIRTQIENGRMPLARYTFLHPDTRLRDTDRAALLEWARNLERRGLRVP